MTTKPVANLEQPKFQQFRHQVISRHRPLSGRELDGLLTDLSYFVEQGGLLRVTKTKKTGEAANLLEVSCEVLSETVTAQEVVTKLKQIWTDELAYQPGLNAITINSGPNGVTLSFVTGFGQAAPCEYATGTVHVKVPGSHS